MSTYRGLFRIREFRSVYLALVASSIGDQLSSIALSVLVLDRTGSAFLTAVAYASAWIPGLVGGPILSSFADRLPRREVLVVCDLARCLCVLMLLIPGMPVGAMIALLYVSHLFTTPFGSARSALLAEILDKDAFVTGNGLANITHQSSVVLGFAAGGLIVATIQPEGALALDALTFAVSACIVRFGLRARPAASANQETPTGFWQDTRAGFSYVMSDPWLRSCLLVVWFGIGFGIAPEAIMYPYARELGGGPELAGVLLASVGVGYIAGALLLTRVLPTAVRDRLIVPFAVLAGIVLLPSFLHPSAPLVIVQLVLLGMAGSFSAPLNAIFALRVSPEFRGRAMGIALAGIAAGLGLGFLFIGTLVDGGLSPAVATGVCGVLGTCSVLVAARGWRPSTHADPAAVVGRPTGG